MTSYPARTQAQAAARTEELVSRTKLNETSLGRTTPSCNATESAAINVGA